MASTLRQLCDYATSGNVAIWEARGGVWASLEMGEDCHAATLNGALEALLDKIDSRLASVSAGG